MQSGPTNLARAELSCGKLAVNPWAGLGLALVAGAIVWGVIQGVHPVFHVPKRFEAPSIGMAPEVYLANRRAREWVEKQHAMLYAGLLGLLTAAALGLGEGIARRSVLPAALATFTGPLGACGGVLGGLLGSVVHEHTLEQGQPELIHTVAEQTAVLLPLGLAVGLGLGFIAGSRMGAVQAALAGLAAGLLAAIAYSIVVALVLPGSSTDMLLPFDAASRALWIGLVAGLLGLVIPVAGRSRRTSAATSPPAKVAGG